MSRDNLARACALAAALVAMAACSDDGDGATAPATTVAGALATSTSAAGSTVAGAPAPSTTTATTTTASAGSTRLIEVAYAGGQVVGGMQRTTVRVGEKVRIRVTSDVADEVHVHTYDVKAAVAPGRPAELELVASIPGRHEVELEGRHRQLLLLEVR